MEEETLIRQAGQGDMEAFATLAQTHGPAVYGFVRARTADSDTAYEKTLETFQRAWHAISLFQFDTELAPWLLHIAEDVCAKGRRRESRTEDETPPPTGEEIARAVSRRITQENMRYSPGALLRRFRFTILAILLALLLLFASRLGLLEGKPMESAPATTEAPQVSMVPAELRPGG